MQLKTCTKCGEEKDISLFPKKKEAKDGLHSWCKECKNIDRKRYKRAKNYREINLKSYYKNPSAWVEAKARRRARKLNATPRWVSAEEKLIIKLIYRLSRLKTLLTGINYEVDHVIPLQGEFVCGLHVTNNLRIITQYENRSKGNTCSGSSCDIVDLTN